MKAKIEAMRISPERLRNRAKYSTCEDPNTLLLEAADEIERLRAKQPPPITYRRSFRRRELGWCADELREVTHFIHKPAPPKTED